MLKLPAVTLVSIDCMAPMRTLRAMRLSMRQARFAATVLVTDLNDPEVVQCCRDWGIRTIHHVTGPRHEYEYDMLEFLPDYFQTEWCLFQEWDAAVANPRAWDHKFLNYDFIGAPWVEGAQEETWWTEYKKPIPGNQAPVTTERNSVGNGGFSLRSKRFCLEVSRRVDRNNPHQLCSDAWMCRTLRPELEKKGLKYAPYEVAENFSCEDRIYSGQFGFHGQGTILLNNWNWKENLV